MYANEVLLKNRKFSVKVKNQLPEEKNTEAGEPQGSLLRPILYMEDITELQYCKIAQFTDDIAIFTHHRQSKILSNRLQTDLDTRANTSESVKPESTTTKRWKWFSAK